MKSIDFPQTNFTFTRPSNMTANQCGSLRVFRGSYPDGTPVSISCFEVSDEELAKITASRKVWLHVIGDGHPPVSLDVDNPWEG